jgi:hypothetical protein
MTGNVGEWNDLDRTSSMRGNRGGDWNNGINNQTSSARSVNSANGESNRLGFRLAMEPVPEPSMMVIGTLFGLGGLMAKRRLKK